MIALGTGKCNLLVPVCTYSNRFWIPSPDNHTCTPLGSELEEWMYDKKAYMPAGTRHKVNLIYTIDSLNRAGVSTSLSHNAVVAAVASSVTVFILSSILFFIVGYVCGYFGQKHKQSTASKETSIRWDCLSTTISTYTCVWRCPAKIHARRSLSWLWVEEECGLWSSMFYMYMKDTHN